MRFKTILFSIFLIVFFNKSNAQSLTNIQLIDSIESILKENQVLGTFVTVVTKDSVLFQEGIGFVNLNKKTKVTKQHLFGIGSVSKTFTAMAILKLVNEGKLNLEDKLSTIAPEIPFSNKWEATHPVKIKHLLTHRAGFDDMHISAIIKKRTANMTALDEALTYKNSYKSNWQPGLVFSYSNPSYAILGFIIEKISSQTYQDYIIKNILQPLNMKSTRYYSTNNNTSQFSKGYTILNDSIVKVGYAKIIGESGGGMLSNAEDMSHFLQYFLNEKLQDSISLIGRKGVLSMETLHSNYELKNNIKTGYSLGLTDRQFGKPEQNFKGHSGGIDGFVTNFIYNRDKNIGIAVSINVMGSGNRRIVDLLVNSFCKNQNEAVYSFKETNLEKFKDWEGTYRLKFDENEIYDFVNYPVRVKKIVFKNNELLISEIGEDPEVFKHIGNNAFKSAGETLPTIYLTTNEGKKSVSYYGSTMLEINGSFYLVLIAFLVLSLVASILITVVFIIQLVVSPFKKSIRNILSRTFLIGLPFWLIVFSLIALFSNMSYLDLEKLGTITAISLSIYLSTLLFPFFCIFAGYKLFKQRKSIKNKWSMFFYTYAFFGILFITVYSVSLGWFALKLWSY